MTRQFYDFHLLHRGHETGVVRTVAVDFEDPEQAELTLAVVLAGAVKADGGNRFDLTDYVFAFDDIDGQPLTFATDLWGDDL